MEEDDKAVWSELTGSRSSRSSNSFNRDSNSFHRHSQEGNDDEPGANRKSLRATMRPRRRAEAEAEHVDTSQVKSRVDLT